MLSYDNILIYDSWTNAFIFAQNILKIVFQTYILSLINWIYYKSVNFILFYDQNTKFTKFSIDDIIQNYLKNLFYILKCSYTFLFFVINFIFKQSLFFCDL